MRDRGWKLFFIRAYIVMRVMLTTKLKLWAMAKTKTGESSSEKSIIALSMPPNKKEKTKKIMQAATSTPLAKTPQKFLKGRVKNPFILAI